MRITLFSSHSFRPLKTRSPLMRAIALGLSFSILTQGVVVPARAEVKSSAVEITSFDRVIFGPKEYVRGTDKVTRFPVQIPLPRELTSPFVLRITQGDPVVANIKVYGNPSISSTEFKPHGQILKEVFPPFPAVILEVLMEGPPGEKFTLELFGRSKVALPPPPHVTILNPLGGAWVGSTASGKVAFDAPGGFGGLTAKLDGSAVTLAVSSGTAEGPLTLTTEGTHTVSATVKDAMGQSANAAVTFKADLTPPQLTLEWPAEGTVVEVSTASFGGAVSDLLSGVRSVTCGGTPATVLYGRWACEVALTPGVNTVAIEAQDQVGNTAQTNRAITYQTAPPEDPTLPPDPAEVAPPLDPTVATSMATSTEFLYTGDNPIQVGVSSGTIKTDYVAVLRGKIIDRAGAALPGATVTVLGHPEYGSTKSRADGMFDMAVNGGGAITLTYEKDGYLTVQRQVNTPWQDWAVVDDAVMIPLDAKVTTVDLTAPVMQVAQGPVVTDESGPRQATLLFPAGTTAEKVNPDGTTEPLTIMKVRATEYTVGPKGPESMPGALPPTSGYTYAVELSADEALDAKTVKFSKPMSFYVDNFLHFPVGGKVPVGYYDRERGVWVPSQNGKIVKVLAPTGDLAELDIDGSDTPATATALLALGVTEDERRELAKLYTAGKTLWRVPITHMTPWDCNWPYGPPKDAKGPNPDEDPSNDGREDDSCRQSGGSVIDCENQTVSESVPITGTPFTLNYISDRVPGHKASQSIRIPVSGSDMPPGVKQMDVDITVAGVTTRRSFTPEASKKDEFKWDGKDAYGREVKGSQKAKVSINYVYDATYREPADVVSSFGLAGVAEISGDRARSQVTLSRKSAVDLDSWEGKPTGIGGWTLTTHHAYQPSDQSLHLGDGTRRTSVGAANVMTTTAGQDERGYSGDGGPAAEARLLAPSGVAVDSLGNLYIADTGNHCVRKVTPDGKIITVAGTGGGGYSGDGGPATEARLYSPYGVAVDSLGNLYIADVNNYRIRKVTPDGKISTVAGTGERGYSGDGGPATEAQLNISLSIAVDLLGNLYLSDAFNSCIRKVSTDGTISTVVRDLSFPYGVTVDLSGNLYIADAGANRIYKVTPDGNRSTVTVTDGATELPLNEPSGVAVDSLGNLYIADTKNNRIRKVTNDGIMTNIAGDGHEYEWWEDPGDDYDGDVGNGGPSTEVRLHFPFGIAVDTLGNLYIADEYNHRVRKVQRSSLGVGLDDIAVPSEDGTALYIFDSTGRHLRTIAAKTRSILYQFAYDGRGELKTITDGDGNVTTIERDDAGRPKSIVAPHGQRTELTLDANGWLTKITNPAGGTYKANYLENGLMYSFTDPNNNTSTMEYDDLGRLVYDRTAAGKVWTVSRGELIKGKEVGLTTALGRTLKYRVQDLPTGDHLRVNTSADGRVTESLRKTDGSTTVTTPTGLVHTVKKTPDPRFKMAAPLPSSKQTMPSGLTREMKIDRTVTLSDPKNPLSLTDETTTVTMNGQIYTTVFSSATRTISGMTPTGRKSVAMLDARGRIAQSKTARWPPPRTPTTPTAA
jgi:YD repeat-containing protein